MRRVKIDLGISARTTLLRLAVFFNMDSLPGRHSWPSVYKSIFRLRVKSHTFVQMFLEQRDYVLGILLLLAVVFLWTASNFVTQVGTIQRSGI